MSDFSDLDPVSESGRAADRSVSPLPAGPVPGESAGPAPAAAAEPESASTMPEGLGGGGERSSWSPRPVGERGDRPARPADFEDAVPPVEPAGIATDADGNRISSLYERGARDYCLYCVTLIRDGQLRTRCENERNCYKNRRSCQACYTSRGKRKCRPVSVSLCGKWSFSGRELTGILGSSESPARDCAAGRSGQPGLQVVSGRRVPGSVGGSG
jgi:hypothetical protein